MSFAPRREKMDVAPGRVLSSKHSTYSVQSLLGQGAFGKVAACTRTRDNLKVAIKTMKKVGNFVEQAKEEVCDEMAAM